MPPSFWNTVLDREQADSMADKYAWLCDAVLDAPGPVSRAALQTAARRWPGSLRECQRVSPARYRAREQAMRKHRGAPVQSYGVWRGLGLAAVCLWSELHRRQAEVLAWRARAPAGRRNDVEAFLGDLTRCDPRRRAQWPPRAVLIASGHGLDARLAELAVAHRAGWDRARLRCWLWDPEPR